jgi:hypothetical protein
MWLHPSTADNVLLQGTNYSIFRADRSFSHYVCILINNYGVKATDLPVPPEFSHLKLRGIDLYGVDKIRLFVCYRPPSHNTYPIVSQYLNDLYPCITGLVQSNGSVILCGDFNRKYCLISR